MLDRCLALGYTRLLAIITAADTTLVNAQILRVLLHVSKFSHQRVVGVCDDELPSFKIGLVRYACVVIPLRIEPTTLATFNSMKSSETLFARLQALGAGEFQHLNGTLTAHLYGTETLLREWGANELLSTAGLYHAVYGTDGYNSALVNLSMRESIATLIGADAEELVYLYGACDRGVFYPRIGTEKQLMFADRFSNTEYEITPKQLTNLCELILANELEIAMGSSAFREKYGASLIQLFERMPGLVSEIGFRTYRQILS